MHELLMALSCGILLMAACGACGSETVWHPDLTVMLDGLRHRVSWSPSESALTVAKQFCATHITAPSAAAACVVSLGRSVFARQAFLRWQAGCSGAPIFVVGSPHSGTSLLLALLDRHDEIAALPAETGVLLDERFEGADSSKLCVRKPDTNAAGADR